MRAHKPYKTKKRVDVKRHEVVQPIDKPYRLIPLTQGQNAIVSVEDFEWLSKWNWQAHSHPGGKFYAVRFFRIPKRTFIYMHKEILRCKDGELGDHINGNTLDNRRENLRAASHVGNSRNVRKGKRNTSGFKGVFWYKAADRKDGGRWCARIRHGEKNTFIGYFPTKEDAARAYDKAARKIHGEFACLNFH